MGNVISRRGVRTVWPAMLAAVGLVIALVPAPAGALPRAASDGASTPWPGGRWQPDAPTYGMAVDANVTVTMDDGVKLVANIGYPVRSRDRRTRRRARSRSC